MRTVVISAILSCVAAFAPSKHASRSTAIEAFGGGLGVQPLIGFYDPLGIIANGGQEV